MACSFGLTQQFAFILLGETNPTRPMHLEFLYADNVFGNLWSRRTEGKLCPEFVSPTPTATLPAHFGIMSDFDGVTALGNEQNTSLGPGEYSRIYDDFNVIESDEFGTWIRSSPMTSPIPLSRVPPLKSPQRGYNW